MLKLLRTSVPLRNPSARHAGLLRSLSSTRVVHEAQKPGYEAKYAKQLQRRATEQGMSLESLRAAMKEQERERLRKLREEREIAAASTTTVHSPASTSSHPVSPTSASSVSSTRTDSTPIKPLSSILNLNKIFETPHTREQISELWRAYSERTGRGLCAVIDVREYEAMVDIALKYPTFVVPFHTEKPPTEKEDKSKDTSPEGLPACVFYMMQWGFYGSPPDPTTTDDLLEQPKSSSNPQTSTVLFTPLEEFKLRQEFATPYLVLTHYTDLVNSHGVVLMRGELTPSKSGAGFMLTQEQAHLLAIQLQRFYLWRSGKDIKSFHEKPAEFDWKTLLEPLA